MRILSLSIRNFRAIETFEISDLKDFIVIAGPNGCGKTTVLDALRLIKSLYVPKEAKRWFQEFGINIDRPYNFAKLFRRPDTSVELKAEFVLSESEIRFIRTNVQNIALGLVLLDEGSINTISGDRPIIPYNISAEKSNEIETEAEKIASKIIEGIDTCVSFVAGATLTMEPRVYPIESPVAHASFCCF